MIYAKLLFKLFTKSFDMTLKDFGTTAHFRGSKVQLLKKKAWRRQGKAYIYMCC